VQVKIWLEVGVYAQVFIKSKTMKKKGLVNALATMFTAIGTVSYG
jgi:hypothetical protein